MPTPVPLTNNNVMCVQHQENVEGVDDLQSDAPQGGGVTWKQHLRPTYTGVLDFRL